MRIGYDDADTLITYPRAHNLSACAQPIRMRRTRPTGAPGGTRALAVKTQPLRVAATAMEWFPNNVACNSPAALSNFEFTSLKFQRFQTLLKRQPIELHAKYRGALPHGAKRGACRVRSGSLSRCARRGRPFLSLGARRAPGAWCARRKLTSLRSDTPAPPTRRPSQPSGSSARSREK